MSIKVLGPSSHFEMDYARWLTRFNYLHLAFENPSDKDIVEIAEKVNNDPSIDCIRFANYFNPQQLDRFLSLIKANKRINSSL